MLNEVRELAMWDLGKEHWRGRGQTFQSHEVIFWHFFFFFFKNMKYSFNSLSSKSIPYLFPILNLTASPKERWKKDLVQNLFWELGQKSARLYLECERKRKAKDYLWVFSPSNGVNGTIIYWILTRSRKVPVKFKMLLESK